MTTRLPLRFREKIFGVLLLVFRPSRIVDIAADHSISSERISNAAFRQSYPGRVPDEISRQHETASQDRLSLLRLRLGTSLLYFAVASALGAVSAIGLGYYGVAVPPLVQQLVLVAALGLFLVSTLARLGWEGQSIKGDTFVEQLDEAVFRASYWCGTALAVFGTFAPIPR